MERDLDILIGRVRMAGRRTLELARDGFEVQMKKDRSPVTSADLEVNRILSNMHQRNFPNDGWLSEESPDDPTRLHKTRVWIVDPIDGTKAFINRMPEFCISAALVEKGRPVLAAVFNPSTDELFTALRGGGLHLNGARVVPTAGNELAPVVMVNSWELRNGRWAWLNESVRCRPMYSIANALALVAAGRVHATITVEPENEWDLAAGVLLIEESGGTIHDAAGNPLTFNQVKPTFRGVIAVSAVANSDLRPLLQQQMERARAATKQT